MYYSVISGGHILLPHSAPALVVALFFPLTSVFGQYADLCRSVFCFVAHQFFIPASYSDVSVSVFHFYIFLW